MKLKIFVLFTICLLPAQWAAGQDTVRVSLQSFIKKGLNRSGQVNAERQDVRIAKNKIRQAQGKRYLPKFDLTTQNGIVPGVKSDRQDLDPNEYYLDPDLDNDFNNLGIFTRVHAEAIQPLYTWGALHNAVLASRAAATAAENKFSIKKDETRLRLYKLYQSYLLSLAVGRLLDDAQNQIKEIDKKLNGKESKQDTTIDESDKFKFEVFKSEFAIRAAQVKQNAKYVQRVWNFVLNADNNTVYMPKKRFLDPVHNQLKPIDYYINRALSNRPELKALNAGISAADYGVKATKAQRRPSLFLGVTGSYAVTPNRPRQTNPFIINKSNYSSIRVGVGLRQNLDFFSLHYDVKKRKLQRRKAEFSKEAAIEGITLQLNKNYKSASISKIRIQRTNDALITAKKWVRQEKLDYDLNLGDPKDLIDSIKKELELKIGYKKAIFNFNEDMADLYKSAALPVSSLKTKYP